MSSRIARCVARLRPLPEKSRRLASVAVSSGDDSGGSSRESARRLRLLFGRFADTALGRPLEGETTLFEIDQDLAFLYDRAYRRGPSRSEAATGSGLGPSVLGASTWLSRIEDLFPADAKRVLAEDAIERFGLAELLAKPAALAAVTPSPTLLALLLRLRSQIPRASMPEARKLVEDAVRELSRALAIETRPSLAGTSGRTGRSSLRVLSNLDAKRTVKENLRHYNRGRGELFVERIVFRKRYERHTKFRVIVLLDQSGSMAESVVSASILAAIFASVPSIDLRLVAFDTHVVDMTEIARDPVEVLFSIQLGGGTLIERAVGYAATLVHEPRRTLLVVISDFREGGSVEPLACRVKDLLDAGVTVLGLVALGEGASAGWDRRVAGTLSALGMPIGAMTPHELAAWVGEHVRRGNT